MTTTYDPHHFLYTDEHDVRSEIARVFDVCFGCQQCLSLCPTFPSLFALIESKVDKDAGRLTPDEQDGIAAQCYRCTMCVSVCPYAPDHHERAVDFPRLIDRHHAMQKKNRQWSMRSVVGHAVLSRMRLVLRFVAPLRPGSLWRHIIGKITGISATHVLAPTSSVRLSTWFAQRTSRVTQTEVRVAVFPTCVVEYAQPQIGQALVQVYEHNNISCTLVGSNQCCGASLLRHGDMRSFVTTAQNNVAMMAEVVRGGASIVVPNPTCYEVITSDYPRYASSADTEFVAAHTFEASEYLVRHHNADASSIDLASSGLVGQTIAHHVPMEMHARGIGDSGRTVLSLAGASVTDISMNSGAPVFWGALSDNEEAARTMSNQLGVAVRAVGAAVVSSDCPWSMGDISSQTSTAALHPMEVLARGYIARENPSN